MKAPYQPPIYTTAFGPKGHGKTTVTAALIKTMAVRRGTPFRLPSYYGTPSRDIVLHSSHYEIRSEKRIYHHIYSDEKDFLRHCIYGSLAQDQSILVHDSQSEVSSSTRETLKVLNLLEMNCPIVYLNQKDALPNAELEALAQEELLEAFHQVGYDPKEVQIFKGDPRKAIESDDWTSEDCRSIVELLRALDHIPRQLPNYIELPFQMPVEDCLSLKNGNFVVTGRIHQGKLQVGDALHILGPEEDLYKKVSGIEMYRKKLRDAQAGDVVGLYFEDTPRDKLFRGQILTASPQDFTHSKHCKILFHFLEEKDGGHQETHETNEELAFYLMTFQERGRLASYQSVLDTTGQSSQGSFPSGKLFYGELHLKNNGVFQKHQRLAIRKNGKATGCGIFLEALDSA